MGEGVRTWAAWIEAQAVSTAIRESTLGYPALLTFHVVSIVLFAGLVLMMDLRLLGVGHRRTPFSQIQRGLFPLQMAAMTAAAASGLTLVYAQPSRFYASVFFWIKMSMIALAGINAMVFHVTTYRSVAAWDAESPMPRLAKLASVLSVLTWAVVIVSGRLIGYQWFQASSH